MQKKMSALLGAVVIAGSASANETLKVAFIDPISGPFAHVGDIMLKNIQFAVDEVNAAKGPLRMELQIYDNKLSAQESQIVFKAAVDAGARVIFTGGSGSTVVAALVETANKHNERNPDKAVLIVNHSSIDPELTGKNCSFWHIAMEDNTAMKMRALTNFMKNTKDIKKVFFLNQDYAHGRAWAKYGREMLTATRPDVQIVGEEFHPIGKVKDFAPYVAKIKASGADTVISGNWGPDLNLLLKAAGDSGLDLRIFNHSAGGTPGTPTAVAQAKMGRLTWVSEWHPNVDNAKTSALYDTFKKRYNNLESFAPRIYSSPLIVAAAATKAKSTEAAKIAAALEGMVFPSVVGEIQIRKDDHQALIPQTVATLVPVDGKTVKFGLEGTNIGNRSEAVFTGKELALPTDCKMTRPAGL